jgi:hypothetical protein
MAHKGKNTHYNSGNFYGIKALARGPDFHANFGRNQALDFSIGPRWGFQRTDSARFYTLFTIGPIYYFDATGAQGIFPLTLELNLGLNRRAVKKM